MVSPASSLLLAAALAAVLAPQLATATSIEVNPITPIGMVSKLDHRNPVFGGRPASDMVLPVVPEDPTMTKAEVYEEVAANGSTDATPADDGAANATSTDGGAATRRKLEVTSVDVQRLEGHFGVKMETNLYTIQQKYAKSQFNPAPWPSSYWPTYQDSINAKWNSNEASPAEKYAKAFGLNVNQFMDTVSSALGIDSQASPSRVCKSNNDCGQFRDGSACAIRAGRSSGYCVPTWYGICHAWAPAAILEAEPACDVVKNGVTFKPFDIKGLVTAVYDGSYIDIVFTGARYDGAGSPIDEYGRYTDALERDIGPGYFHIAVANIMGRFGKSFVVDINADAQVWNQPVRGYEIKEIAEMSPATAAQAYFKVPKYPFNDAAVSVAFVHLTFSYINEWIQDGPLVSTGIVDSATVNHEYYYLVELDAQKNIIGGEWLGDSQTNHPDFLWFAASKPADNAVTGIGLSYANVRDLLRQSASCSTNPTTQPPTPTTPTPPAPNGECGNDQVGPQACPSGQYCQPWNPTFYQCRTLDAKCGKQETGVDYYGDDISTHQLLLPELCCEKCIATTGCKAYTFVNYNADGKAYCYLKKGSGQRQAKVGVVSAVIVASNPSTCSTPAWGNCGNSNVGASCCPSSYYCQPWDTGYFQCIQTPAKCSAQYPNVDFYGDDLATVYGIGPGECCAKCAATAGCKAYTYVNDNMPQTACYLKKGMGAQRYHATAVSATLN